MFMVSLRVIFVTFTFNTVLLFSLCFVKFSKVFVKFL
jgi:hypothetical protein